MGEINKDENFHIFKRNCIKFEVTEEINEDKGYEQLCYNLYKIHCIHRKLIRSEERNNIEIGGIANEDNSSCSREDRRKIPIAPSNLISIQDTKIICESIKMIFENILSPCISNASKVYFKSLPRAVSQMDYGIKIYDPNGSHMLIFHSFKHVLLILKVPSYRPSRDTLYIIFTILLQLCFCPDDINSYPDDKKESRDFLEEFILLPILWNEWVTYLILQSALQSKAGCGRSWLSQACNALFVHRFLLSSSGVKKTLFCLPSPQGELSWNHREAQAKIISGASIKDVDFFFKKIGPQIISLLNESSLNKEHYSVLCLVLSQLCQKSCELSQQYIFTTLLQPLIQTTIASEDSSFHFHSDKELTDCFELIKKIYMHILPPSSHLSIMVEQVLHPLFAVAKLPPMCHLKTSCMDIIIRYLTLLEGEECLNSLLELAELKTFPHLPNLKNGIVFKSSNNQISVENAAFKESSDLKFSEYFPEDDEFDSSCLCMVQILDKLKNPNILIMFYEYLVKSLDFTVLNYNKFNSINEKFKNVNFKNNDNFDSNNDGFRSTNDKSDFNDCKFKSKIEGNYHSESTLLLTDSDLNILKSERMKALVSTCNILNAITTSDSMNCILFANIRKIVPILTTLLGVNEQQCNDDDLAHVKAGLVDSTVILISCFINEQAKKLSRDEWDILQNLLPKIKELKQSRQETGSNNRFLKTDTYFWAERLEYAILTRGVITADLSTTELGGQQGRNDDAPAADEIFNKHGIEKCPEESGNTNVTYSGAMSLIMSPQVPFIANGILQLSKLLKAKDEKALRNKGIIMELFQRYLSHEDSYVYLMAINGLASMSTTEHEIVFPLLCSSFVSPHHPATRAKIGEALCRAIEDLGPICVKFRNLICNTLINGLKDTDPTVRSSSLSSLSQFCMQSKYSLGPIIHEIFHVLEALIRTDKSLQVKRASVMLIAMMIKGLERDTFMVLKDVLLSLYRILKQLSSTEYDPALLTHVNEALLEIDKITKDFISPKMSLSKQIFITQVPQ